MVADASHAVEGHVSRGFEAVREASADNFARRHELGSACCAYVHGEKVVDLWGGIRNKETGEPWERDTMVLVYSATKGLSAMTLAIAHSRGWLDYEERDSSYAGANAVVGSRRASQYLRDDAVGGGVGSLLSARPRPRLYQADCDHFRRLAGAREADIPRQ